MVVGLFGSSANWGRLKEQAGEPGLQTPPGHAVLLALGQRRNQQIRRPVKMPLAPP